jgi:hypothetical protein
MAEVAVKDAGVVGIPLRVYVKLVAPAAPDQLTVKPEAVIAELAKEVAAEGAAYTCWVVPVIPGGLKEPLFDVTTEA